MTACADRIFVFFCFLFFEDNVIKTGQKKKKKKKHELLVRRCIFHGLYALLAIDTKTLCKNRDEQNAQI